jgi:hypothetical protein
MSIISILKPWDRMSQQRSKRMAGYARQCGLHALEMEEHPCYLARVVHQSSLWLGTETSPKQPWLGARTWTQKVGLIVLKSCTITHYSYM